MRERLGEGGRERGRGWKSRLCSVTMATPLTCSCHTCCHYRSITQPFTLCLCPKDKCLWLLSYTNVIFKDIFTVYMCVFMCVCLRVCMCESFQSASVNVPWVLAVIMSVSWCLAEKAALKGVFRHLSPVITLNYYHSLNCGSPAHAYVCLCERFRGVRSPVKKGKASGQISELNTSHPHPCGAALC